MDTTKLRRGFLAAILLLLGPGLAGTASAGTNRLSTTGPQGGFFTAFAFGPASSATVYAGSRSGGVFKSINGGVTWFPVTGWLENSLVNTLVIDPSAPGTLYAGTSGSGVFKTTNGGASWDAVNTGLGSVTGAVRTYTNPQGTAFQPIQDTSAFATCP